MVSKKVTDLTALTAGQVDRATDVIEISDVSASQSKKVTPNALMNISGNAVGDTDSQTLTNKTLTAPTISGPTLSGTVLGTYTLGGTPTFPSSVATLTGIQTLTNKTLTSPTINTATIVNPTITADSIAGFSSSTTGTIYGVSVTAGVINTANTVNGASLVAASVGSTALATNALQGNQIATTAIFLGFSTTTTSQGSIVSTETDLTTLAVTVTVPAGSRAVKITADVWVSSTISADIARLFIKEGATYLGSNTTSLATTPNGYNLLKVVYVPAPSAGSHTYKLALQRAAGTGTLTSNAGAESATNTRPFILVEAI